MPKRKQELPYIVGEKGANRVRLYAHERTKFLYLEFRDENQRKVRRSLGTKDVDVGKRAAEELALALRKNEGPALAETTLGKLFENYEREVTPSKSAAKQKHDKRARALFEACWGSGTRVVDLDRRDWDKFIAHSGEADHAVRSKLIIRFG